MKVGKHAAVVGIVMGSRSDWDIMSHAAETLVKLGIAYEARALSAHRSPQQAHEYAATAEKRGLKIVIAAAGAAAHLAGAMAANTQLPVLGVPIPSTALNGIDSLLATVQMPAGIPVGTLAIGKPGAINAALFAAAILALSDPAVAKALEKFRADQTAKVLSDAPLELPKK